MPSRIVWASSAYRRACLSATARLSPAALEAFARVLADRLQHPEPAPLTPRLDESFVDERLELVEDVLAGVGADDLDVRECAPSSEDRYAPKQALLRLVEQRVAPVDRGAQRLLPLGSVARARREHVEGVVEPLEQRVRGEEAKSGGCELERQRQTVQPSANRRDGVGVLGREVERASDRSGALDEELDGRICQQRLRRARLRRWRERERGEGVFLFGGNPERRPACGHDLQPGAALD